MATATENTVETKRAAIFALRTEYGIDITQTDLSACLSAGCPGEDKAFPVDRIAAWIRENRTDLLVSDARETTPEPVGIAPPQAEKETSEFGPVEPCFCPYHNGKVVRCHCNGTRGASVYYKCPECGRTYSNIRSTIAEIMQKRNRRADEPFAARDFN